jgi:hypothetical protein
MGITFIISSPEKWKDVNTTMIYTHVSTAEVVAFVAQQIGCRRNDRRRSMPRADIRLYRQIGGLCQKGKA